MAHTHQTMIWTRQRQANQLRSMLREFYPAALEAFGDDLAGTGRTRRARDRPHSGRRTANVQVAAGQHPAQGRSAANLQTRAEETSNVLRVEHLRLLRCTHRAYGISVRSLVAVLTTMAAQAAALEGEVERCLGQHPDAEIITSQPGLVGILDRTPPTTKPSHGHAANPRPHDDQRPWDI